MSARRDRVVCACLGVCESELRSAVRTGSLHDLASLAALTLAGTGCTGCHPDLRRLLAEEGAPAGSDIMASIP